MRAVKIILAGLLLGIAFGSTLLTPQSLDVMNTILIPPSGFMVLLATIPVPAILGIAIMNMLGENG
jgi:hypothetical protein